jgi:hypothetical protein
MGNTPSTIISQPPPTPASSFFPPSKQLRRKSIPQPLVTYPRRSIFAHDEDEPDDLTDSPRDGVLVGWTRTEQGFIIPQIRSLPTSTPLDDTIFNSPPRLPWVERTRSRSPVPSARSIPRMRQFSIESFRSVVKRELRVINGSRPATAISMEYCTSPRDDMQEDRCSDADSFDWQAFPDPAEELRRYGEEADGMKSVNLKRGNSTNDSGYSTMAPDTGSCSDDSEDPWWWEEAAGYSTTYSTTVSPTFEVPDTPIFTQGSAEHAVQYLQEEREESAYISNLLRNNPFDEWSEWRTTVTKLLMIPEEEENIATRPVTPVAPSKETSSPRSPTRRRSLFNFARKKKSGLNKRKSLLW